eukprot:g40631.t1
MKTMEDFVQSQGVRDSQPDGPNNLTEHESSARAACLSNISYGLSVALYPKATHFAAAADIKFDLKKQESKAEEALFLDFVGATIVEMKVNSAVIKEPSFKSNRIYLPDAQLVDGTNQVEVRYVNAYNHDGKGFHQFVDPVDQKEYLFTDFEPFDCHRLLPCFDQPSLRAPLSLQVSAPKHWTCVSVNPALSSRPGAIHPLQPHPADKLWTTLTEPLAKGHELQTWVFKPTPCLSTYIFVLVAGEYVTLQDSYTREDGSGSIPLGLLCRGSLLQYCDKEELFTLTKNGFAFYEKFFGMPYPFEKYDQCFCPEYNWGAMENPGCVTWNEGYLFRDTPTEARRCRRADTLLHEMAHMWFGDMVSPVWWDGLWLNESFATFMAALATAECTRFGDMSWLEFNAGKQGGYRDDQLPTTHPVQGIVQDTTSGFLSFDSITYEKGAALIKQLVFGIGMDAFQKGMRLYFAKHAWGNTTIGDFLNALERGFEQTQAQVGKKRKTPSPTSSTSFEAKTWSAAFLETCGVNTLSPHISLQDGKIASFVIEQTGQSAEHNKLRPHVVQVALLDWTDPSHTAVVLRGEPHQQQLQPASHTDLTAVFKGQSAPAFVFVNHGDTAFVKVKLDAASEQFARQHLEYIQDPLLRQLVWFSFNDMMRDGHIPATVFLALVRQKLPSEDNHKLIQTILTRAQVALQYVPDAMLQREADLVFELALGALQKLSANDTQLQVVWGQAVLSFCCSKAKTQLLAAALKGDGKLAGWKLEQGHRWQAIQLAMAWNIDGAKELLAKEKELDPSELGVRHAIQAASSAWDPAVKKAAWARFLDTKTSGDVSLYKQQADMAGFFWRHQKDVLRDYVSPFFENVVALVRKGAHQFGNSFLSSCFPDWPEDPSIAEAVQKVLSALPAPDKAPPSDQLLRKRFRIHLDDLNRIARGRKVCQQAVAAA